MKIIKKIFCFVAITVFLVSGIFGSFYDSANIKVYATSSIPIGQIAYELFSLTHDGLEQIEDETHFCAKIEHKIIDTANSYIPMSALKTYLSLFYKTNKSALTKKGYTSAEDFINSMAFANTTAFLTWFRDSAYTEKLPMTLDMVKCMYNAVKVSFKEENADVKEDENGNIYLDVKVEPTDLEFGNFIETHLNVNSKIRSYYEYSYLYNNRLTHVMFKLNSYSSDSDIYAVLLRGGSQYNYLVFLSHSPLSMSYSSYVYYDSINDLINTGSGPGGLNSFNNVYCRYLLLDSDSTNGIKYNFACSTFYGYTVDSFLKAVSNGLVIEDNGIERKVVFPTYTDEQLQNLIDHVPGEGDITDDDDVIVDPTVPDEPIVPEPTAPTSDFPGLFSWLKAIWQVLTTNVSYSKSISSTIASLFTPTTKTANNTTKMVDLLSTITKFAVAWANPTSISVTMADAIGDVLLGDKIEQKLITIFPSATWWKDVIETIPATVALAMSNALGIPEDKATLWQNITTYPKLIFDLLDGKWSVFPADLKTWIGGVTDAIRDLPISIGDVIADGLAVSFPDAIDYTNPLARIIALIGTITDFLILDQSAVSASAASIAVTANSKFGYMAGFGNLYDQFNFTNNYTYPCFKMGMPDILVPYLGKEIILIDFKDYATQFLAVRLFLRAMIWFSFVHHVAKLLTPRFRIS